MGFPCGSAGKESTCSVGDLDLIPGLGRSPGEGKGYPLQYSWASLMAQLVKIHVQCGRPGFDPWVGKIPRRRERLPIPVFWPGEFHGLSTGSQRVVHCWTTFTFIFMPLIKGPSLDFSPRMEEAFLGWWFNIMLERGNWWLNIVEIIFKYKEDSHAAVT